MNVKMNIFKKQYQTCLICSDMIPGIDCIRLYRCSHFYCRFCLNNYIQINLENGLFGEKLHCPQYECKQSLLPTEIKQIPTIHRPAAPSKC
ncbi:unnamed protein product [Rotaria sp. Silwood1]|nr:unnamed protein product [Rotaria sp. Silwood1]